MPLASPPEQAPQVAQSLFRRTMTLPVSEFVGQWRNPNDVLSVVLIIGAETVRSALAHLAGNSTFVPVCFSFGWVAFSFNNIVSIAGEGRLMPNPDYPCKIINAESGYSRENRSWMVGRLLRDNEHPLTNEALCVTVWRAVSGTKGLPKAGHSNRWSRIFIMNGLVMVVQLVIAAIPWMLYEDWSIFLIAAVGTVLALMMGALPQWRAEKFSCRTNESKKDVLITRGIGTRHVMMIIGDGNCLDIEDLAGGESPRSYRMWQNFYNLDANKHATNDPSLPPPANSPLKKRGVTLHKIMTGGGERPGTIGHVPIAFWFTRIICFIFAILWICLLISVAGLKTNAWYLLLVGAIGMIQNSFVAGFRQDMVASGVHLEKQENETVKGPKVMRVLMDLEIERPNAGLSLMCECKLGSCAQWIQLISR